MVYHGTIISMNELFDTIRFYDYGMYYDLYWTGLNNKILGTIFIGLAKYGIVIFFLTFAYLIWNKRINAFLCSFFALGLAGFADFVITIFWTRPRPFIVHHDLITPITQGLQVDPNSFPSGHTYIVFAIAASIFLYGHKRLGVILFVLAILVAVARIGAGLHYPSDVIAGALLGLSSGAVAYLVVQRLEEYWEDRAS